ncbi:MAG: hypothetical protein KGJ35_01890, partial [Patescibacteria group bacterium]|nr:hypothetical protein [Patescibacteria group bacterium]
MKEEKKEIELIVIVGILILAIAVLPILYSIFSKTFAPYTAVFLKSYAPVILVISQNIFGWILGITIPV